MVLQLVGRFNVVLRLDFAGLDLCLDVFRCLGMDYSKVGVGRGCRILDSKSRVFGNAEAEARKVVENLELERAVGRWNVQADGEICSFGDFCTLIDTATTSADDSEEYKHRRKERKPFNCAVEFRDVLHFLRSSIHIADDVYMKSAILYTRLLFTIRRCRPLRFP